MSDKKSTIETIEEKIKRAAKEAEDFADKVTADEEPTVLEETPPAKPVGKSSP